MVTKLQMFQQCNNKCFAKKSYRKPVLNEESVLSPGRGLAGFPQEKLRWRIKSQEDAPVWAQRQATVLVKRTLE